jgi:hypothetical protein
MTDSPDGWAKAGWDKASDRDWAVVLADIPALRGVGSVTCASW